MEPNRTTQKREREERVTKEQKTILVEFMEEHENFSQNRFLGTEGRKIWASMWLVLSTQLNSAPGPQKTIDKWQRVWTDMKNKVKKKRTAIKLHKGATGGGKLPNVVLTELEKKILALVSPDADYDIDESDEISRDSLLEIKHEIIPMEPQPGTSQETSISFMPIPFVSEILLSRESTPYISETRTESEVEENVPTSKRRRKERDPLLRDTLGELVEEIKMMRTDRQRTNELLEDIAQSLRTLSNK